MSPFLESIFTLTTLTAAVTAIVSGFWKLLLDRELTRIKAHFSGELERLKNSLLQDRETFLLVYKNQFEVEFNTYQEIWSALQESQIAINAMRVSGPGERQRETYNRFEKLHSRNYILFEQKRPFYSLEIYKLLIQHHILEWDQCQIANRPTPNEPLSIRKSKERFEADDKATIAFNNSYRGIAEAIRTRINSMRVVA